MANKTPTFPGARTGRGQVLAVLLSNRDQSGAEPLQGRVSIGQWYLRFNALTMAASETHSFPANTADGRASWATVYSLPEKVIATALAAGGQDWLDSRRG